jgi:hypothetical protein
MALYDTRFGLPQGVVDYLNQGLPSISGIFQPSGPSIPTPVSVEDVITEEGIASLYPQVVESGDDGGFNPFDIKLGDSGIKTPDQYSPYAYRQALEKSFVGDPNEYGYRTNTEAQKMMDNYPDYYESKPLTGIEKLLTQLPTTGGFIKAADALGDILQDKGSIFKNELLGQGITLDSLGRIVTNNYNSPQGIMAGYNPVSGGLLNMLTGGKYGEPTQYGLENAVAKRQENMRNTLQDKYGLSNQQIEDVLSEIEETGTYTGPLGFNQTMGKTTNLFEDLFNLGQFDLINKNALKKSNLIFEQKLKEKRESDPAFIEQQKIEKAAKDNRDFQQTVKKAADEKAATAREEGAAKSIKDAAKKAAEKKAAYKKAEENRDAARGGGGGGSAPSSGSKKDSGFESASSKPSGRGRQDF